MNPRWSEPRLELIEKTILVGKYGMAQDRAEQFLGFSLTPRDELILKANRAVATALCDSNGLEESKRDRFDVIEARIEPEQREDWKFKPVWDHVKSITGLPGITAEGVLQIKDELFSHLSEAQKKLMSDEAVEQLKGKPPFRK